jgi:hypothetical protein
MRTVMSRVLLANREMKSIGSGNLPTRNGISLREHGCAISLSYTNNWQTNLEIGTSCDFRGNRSRVWLDMGDTVLYRSYAIVFGRSATGIPIQFRRDIHL